jgi:hypothetical protein
MTSVITGNTRIELEKIVAWPRPSSVLHRRETGLPT